MRVESDVVGTPPGLDPLAHTMEKFWMKNEGVILLKRHGLSAKNPTGLVSNFHAASHLEKIFVFRVTYFESTTFVTMASAYKSAMRLGDSSDSEASNAASSEQSSNTIRAESPEDAKPFRRSKEEDGLSQASLEIRNRILMLTTRGVSYR